MSCFFKRAKYFCLFMGKFVQSLSVRASEIDTEFRFRRTAAAAFFQEVFARFVSSKTLAAFDLAKIGLTWITSDMQVVFADTMPFWRDKIDVEVWIRQSSGIRIFGDFRGVCNGTEVFKGSSVQLIADVQNHKPQRADEFLARFKMSDERALPDCVFSKIPSLECVDNSVRKIVRSFDLDFNNHLNNVQYLPISFESIPDDFRNAHSLNSYRIKFLREGHLGNTVVSNVQLDRESKTSLHSLVRAEDNLEMCRIVANWY